VVCMDARAAADAAKSRRVKSDKADAYALAEMLRTGWYRAVYVKSQDSHRLKAMLGARDQLVRAKRALGRCADYRGRLVFDCRRGRGPRSSPRRRIRRCGAITCSTQA
jgi:transposase